MAINTTATITALEAEAKASLFLSDCTPDRLMAGSPRPGAGTETWMVPVLLSYPVIGPVGEVGEIIIDARSGEVKSHAGIEEMLSSARTLYDKHRDAIEAAIS